MILNCKVTLLSFWLSTKSHANDLPVAYSKAASLNKIAGKTKLEMWDIGNNWGKERYCLCGEKETTEHILECWKVREIVKKKAAKNWLQSGRGEELGQATEYIKTYMANREN